MIVANGILCLVCKWVGNIFCRFDAFFVWQVTFFHTGNNIIEERLQGFSICKAFLVSGDVNATVYGNAIYPVFYGQFSNAANNSQAANELLCW